MRTRSHLSVSLVAAAMLLGIAYSAARAKDPEGKATAKTAVKQRKKLRQLKGRLPDYFRTVVTEEQRQKIYAIQREYGPEIRKLKAQLKALTDDRNAKIDALLTPEQRKQIAELKKAAKAKRKKARERAAQPEAVKEKSR